MKLSSLLVAGSLAVNAALLAVYISRSTAASADLAQTQEEAKATAASTGPMAKTFPAAKNSAASAADPNGGPGNRSWATLNGGDLRALAEKLRLAGFPPSAVRAVVNAQLSETFKSRRAALMPPQEAKPFWSTETGMNSTFDPKLLAGMRALNREQGRLAREIVGDDPDAAATPISDNQRRRYGDLSRDKLELLQRIEEDYNELKNDAQAASRGIILPEDRQKLAILEQEKRADLAQVLSPAELEGYLMRSSQTTATLRRSLTTMNATEAEFRAIYAAQSVFDEKYSFQNMGGAFNLDISREREQAQKSAAEQIKASVGDERFADYLRASDREFQQLARVAQEANLPTGAAEKAYAYRASVAKESGRIFDDPALSVDQKRGALKSLAEDTRVQINALLGPDAGSNYLKVADRWLTGLERGSAVSFPETGGMRIRGLPTTRPPGMPPPPGALPPAATRTPAGVTPAIAPK